MSCPHCKKKIESKDNLSAPIAAELAPLVNLKKAVEEQALVHARDQGILGEERLADENDFYHGKSQEYANHRCSFYQCFECKKPYFGGLIDCE